MRPYVFVLVGLVSLLCPVELRAQTVLLDDFEDGDTAGWGLQGAGELLSRYSVTATHPGCGSAFALRVTMGGVEGWCGAGAPRWRVYPATNATGLELDARAGEGCGQLLIDVHLAGGGRYWSLVPLPQDGSWLHVKAAAGGFFPVDNTDPVQRPLDFGRIGALWFTLWPEDGRAARPDAPPATLDLDNVALVGEAVPPAASAAATVAAEPVALPGVTALIARTDLLPGLGQDPAAPTASESVLLAAGATVVQVTPGRLELPAATEGTVLVWEGPVCRTGDWAVVAQWLERGGGLLWSGAGLPFSRPVTEGGEALPEDTEPWRVLTRATAHGQHPLEASGPWSLTAEGQALWPGLPPTLPPGKCRYQTVDDSIYLHSHWPWVEVTPLLTLGYQGRNWIALERGFTGSVATLYRHASGQFAGARVLLATTGRGPASPFSPRNGVFAAALTGAVRELGRPAAVDRSLARDPGPAPAVERASFFDGPVPPLGALDFGVTDWGDPEGAYAARRLGLNVMVAGIPWLGQPAGDGSVVDWAVTDRLVRQARDGGWRVIFDGYCFGYARFPWACEGPGGQTAAPASIHNPVFRERFRGALVGLAARYAADPTVVGLFATPDTGTSAFGVEDSQVARASWERHASALGLPTDLPRAPAPGGLDLSPARAAYVEFWYGAYRDLMSEVIGAVRAVTPEMPLLLRGVWLDVSPSFRLASEFRGVAPHCECVETSVDVEAQMRGFALRYRVPISAENGWPKARGAALRMACATTLLGGYSDLTFSFGGPTWARPGLRELQDLARVWPTLRSARLVAPQVGVLIPDATIWASEPPNFFAAEGRPHVQPFMERTGVPFMAVSAQWPRLDGLRVLVDDGRNDVLPATARRQIADWVRAGGTLIAYPEAGRCDAEGNGASLPEELGVDFAALAATSEVAAVGEGKVVVLPLVPVNAEGPAGGALLAALAGTGAFPTIQVDPAVNQAVLQKGDRLYVVLYNKRVELVGAFFDEARLASVTRALPDLRLSITLPPGMTRAHELLTSSDLPVTDGKATMELPATCWRVLELAP